MEAILAAIPGIAELGITAFVASLLGVIIWRMFIALDKKDERADAKDEVFLAAVKSFQKDVKENNERRSEDGEKVITAVNNLSDLVKFIHGGAPATLMQKETILTTEPETRERLKERRDTSESDS